MAALAQVPEWAPRWEPRQARRAQQENTADSRAKGSQVKTWERPGRSDDEPPCHWCSEPYLPPQQPWQMADQQQ